MNRREFFRGVFMAGATTVVAPRLVAAEEGGGVSAEGGSLAVGGKLIGSAPVLMNPGIIMI